MTEKKLSEDLRHCLEQDGCSKCSCFETKSVLTCPGLLQKAYEVVKKYEEMFPCKVGDAVYRVQKETANIPNMIYECRVMGIKQEFNTFSVKLHANINEESYSIWVDDWFDRCQLGYEFYLTQEDAENALGEMEDSSDKNHYGKIVKGNVYLAKRK